MITYIGAGVNVLLSGLKALSGYLLHSPALIADAVHSLSDIIADGMALVTVKKSRQDPDSLYPYPLSLELSADTATEKWKRWERWELLSS